MVRSLLSTLGRYLADALDCESKMIEIKEVVKVV